MKKPTKSTVVAPASAWPKKLEAGPRQLATVQDARERGLKRRAAMPFDARKGVDGKVEVGGTVTDEDVFFDRMLDVTGTRSKDWMNGLLNSLINVRGGKADANSADTVKEGVAFMNGVAPQDELEAALGAQMFAVHCATMTCARQMASSETRDALRDYGNLLVKTSRTFAAQVEALAKLRTGGKQQVVVTYVDARGSQNVIGDVRPGGGGAGPESNQPHVPGLAFAPGVSVWSDDTAGHGLPPARDAGSEPVPTSRRKVAGRAKREGERALSNGDAHARDTGGSQLDCGPGEAGQERVG